MADGEGACVVASHPFFFAFGSRIISPDRDGRSIEIGSEIRFCKGGLPLVDSLTACSRIRNVMDGSGYSGLELHSSAWSSSWDYRGDSMTDQ